MPTEAPSPEAIRAELLLEPDLTFLNHGSYGATPASVMAVAEGFRREMEANPVAFLDPGRALAGRLQSVRRRLGAVIGANPRDFALIENATEGVNIVARSLDLKPGDEVLTTDHEYAACEKLWARIAAESGAKIVAMPLVLANAAAFTKGLRDGFTPRTRVLFLSHVTSATALQLPIAPILAEARARGIFTLIDGAHAPGLVPLDLSVLEADAYAGNAHKWLMASKGAAFLHVRLEHQSAIRPLILSHGWQEGTVDGPFGGSRFIDALETQGTRDMAAFLSLPAALDWQAARGWPQVSAHAAERMQAASHRIIKITRQPLLAAQEFLTPQMVAFPLPLGTDPIALKAALFAQRIEIPCYHWQNRPILRLSVAGYTTDAELGHLVATLRDLL